MADWRAPLLAGVRYAAAPDESVGVRWGRASLGHHEVVVAVWEFAVHGGSFGVRESRAFAAACATAAAERKPLVSLVRSGGTRLQEGVAALAGMPRTVLALDRLSNAGVAHLAVADQPTTGGVWATVVSRADLRAAVEGAVVGFAGPRVVEAITGAKPGSASHRAETAHTAGLVDALLPGSAVAAWLEHCLDHLVEPPSSTPPTTPISAPPLAPDRGGWAQVVAARAARRAAGPWLAALLTDALTLSGSGGASEAWVGSLAGHHVVAYVLGPQPGLEPGVADYALLERCADLAGRFDRPLLTAVDTPGADPRSASENAGIAPAIGAAMSAVLRCPSPTLGVLLGEGGSGGALAALACDRLWLTPDSYFAALLPEGAAAALRTTPPEAAELLRLRPTDVAGLRMCDGLIDAAAPAGTLISALDNLVSRSASDRLAVRADRWG